MRSASMGQYQEVLKGQYHEIFNTRFFSLNGTPGSPDSWAKLVLHIDSNSRRNSIQLRARGPWGTV
jgi:hypothetical protein